MFTRFRPSSKPSREVLSGPLSSMSHRIRTVSRGLHDLHCRRGTLAVAITSRGCRDQRRPASRQGSRKRGRDAGSLESEVGDTGPRQVRVRPGDHSSVRVGGLGDHRTILSTLAASRQPRNLPRRSGHETHGRRGFKSISSLSVTQPWPAAEPSCSFDEVDALTQGSSNALKMRSAVADSQAQNIGTRSRMYSHRRTTQIRTGRKPLGARAEAQLSGEKAAWKSATRTVPEPKAPAARLAPKVTASRHTNDSWRRSDLTCYRLTRSVLACGPSRRPMDAEREDSPTLEIAFVNNMPDSLRRDRTPVHRLLEVRRGDR